MEEIVKQKTEDIFIDSTSNFWDDLKERINAPFFISFVISWCFINWKVLVLLFWYSNNEIYADKKVYRIDAISNEICWIDSFFWPLLATVLYTFIYPYVKEYLRTYNAEVKTKGNQWINKVSKDESFQIRNYFRLKNLYNNKIKQLEEQRLEEAAFILDRENFEKEKIEIQARIIALENNVEINNKSNKANIEATNIENFVGTWVLYTAERNQLFETSHQIIVTKNELQLLFMINDVINKTACRIKSYSFNPFDKRIIIYSINNLSPINDEEVLILTMKNHGEGWRGSFFVNTDYYKYIMDQTFWFFKKNELESDRTIK